MGWTGVWSVALLMTGMHWTSWIDGCESLKHHCELGRANIEISDRGRKTVDGGYLEPVFDSGFGISRDRRDWRFVVDAGKFVRIRCNPGFRVDGKDLAQCRTDGNLSPTLRCIDIDECKIISDDVEEPEYSLTYDYGVEESNEDIGTGYPAEYPCTAPFHCRNGHGTFLCSNDQEVSDLESCTDVDIPDFGQITEQSQVHVKFTCSIGRRLVGSSQRLCVDGEWDGDQPTCQALTCAAPSETINNGWSTATENVTYEYGDEVRYGCNESYRLVGGNERRVCTAPSQSSDEAQWSGTAPSCQVIQCPYIDGLANGYAFVTSRLVGAKANFRCHSGFELRGAPIRECRNNGRWSGTITTCNDPGTFCPTPEVPSYGRIEGSTNYDLGDVITYHCNYGYDLIGLNQRNCTSNGQWSGKVPMCLGKGEFNDHDDVIRFAEQLRQTAAEYNKPSNEIPQESQGRYHITSASLNFAAQVIGPGGRGRISSAALATGPGGRGRISSASFATPATGPGTDIIFLFDVSKSVRDSSLFNETVSFAKEFVSKVGVSSHPKSGVKYAIVPYASRASTQMQLKDANSLSDVFKALDHIISGAESLGDGTATSLALQMVHQDVIPLSVMNTDNRGRSPETKKQIFLLTDGKSNMNGSPEIEAHTLKERFEVTITCIGVGEEADRGELNRIASEDSNGNKNVHILKQDGLREVLELLLMTEQDYSACGQSKGLKATDATTDDIKVWPWQAGIYTLAPTLTSTSESLPSFFCGGTLIAPNWILSAAHCFDKNEKFSLTNRHKTDHLLVVMGTADRVRSGYAEDGIKIRVNRTIIHPDYNTSILPKYDYDIALLELAEPVKLGPYIRTVCRPPKSNWTKFYQKDENTFVTGWGKSDTNKKSKFSETLKQLRLPIQDQSNCKIREPERNGNITDRMFCAGKGDGIDACEGDSGGPIVRAMKNRNINGILGDQWFQVGIVSWGIGCGNPNHYGYYSHIARLNEWIDDIIGSEDLP